MKTIEEAAKEISFEIYKSTLTDGQQLHIGEESTTEESVLKAIENAFKACVEFAQRWIPVEEEMPETQELVLTKGFAYDISKNKIETYDTASIFTGEDNKKHFFTTRRGYIVTHWRPIELK